MPRRIPFHRPQGILPRAESRRELARDYDANRRDQEARAFYHSARWKAVRAEKLRLNPLCERCYRKGRRVPAVIVHHVEERSERPDLELVIENLESACRICHGQAHGQSE